MKAGPANLPPERPPRRQRCASPPTRRSSVVIGHGGCPPLPRLQESLKCLLAARSAAPCNHTWLSLARRSSHRGRRTGRYRDGRGRPTEPRCRFSKMRRRVGRRQLLRLLWTALEIRGGVAGGLALELDGQSVLLSKEGAMSSVQPLIDVAGRRRSPAAMPGFRTGKAPRNRVSVTPLTRPPSRRSSRSCAKLNELLRSPPQRPDRRALPRRAADQRGAVADRNRSRRAPRVNSGQARKERSPARGRYGSVGVVGVAGLAGRARNSPSDRCFA